MLHIESVEPSTLELLKRIQALPALAETRLVGGTALALQLGHRMSVDLDIFGHWDLNRNLEAEFSKVGTTEKHSGAVDAKLQFFDVAGVKIDCVTYDAFPWLETPIEEEGVRLAGISDIAAMKVNAITNRGTRKDFVDMTFLLRTNTMKQIFKWYRQKYPTANPALAVRSLVYFVDAEEQPMPRMLVPFDWEVAKDEIRAAVRSLFGGM